MLTSTPQVSMLAGAALAWGASAQAYDGPLATTLVQLPAHGFSHVATYKCSTWAERQIAELLSLQDRWHEFDADPIQMKTISQLRAIMCAASYAGEHTGHIVPGADGSLQAEWHLDRVAVGVLVEDDGGCSAWARFTDDGSQVEEFGLRTVDFLRGLAVAYRLNV